MKVTAVDLKKLQKRVIALHSGSNSITSFILQNEDLSITASFHHDDLTGCFISGNCKTSEEAFIRIREQVVKWIAGKFLGEEQTL